jgi:hypothetical protein
MGQGRVHLRAMSINCKYIIKMSFLGSMSSTAAATATGDAGLFEQESAFASMFTLSKTQRLYGFGICVAAGFICSILGSIMLFFLQIASFAAFYTIGSILSLMGTGFLVGPVRQLKQMFDPTRRIATSVFLIAMILTIVCAFIPILAGLALIMVIVQYCAFVWYCASYIPYGRTIITNCFGGLFK